MKIFLRPNFSCSFILYLIRATSGNPYSKIYNTYMYLQISNLSPRTPSTKRMQLILIISAHCIFIIFLFHCSICVLPPSPFS